MATPESRPAHHELDEDERRIVREDITEAELPMFHLLTRLGPNLTADEREAAKGITKEFLDRTTDKLVLGAAR